MLVDCINEFNSEVLGINREIGPMTEEESNWFVGVIHEEVDEYLEAFNQKDFIGQIDAVCDLTYFAIGALTRMGISKEKQTKIFMAIHDCNMQKQKGKKEEREVQIEMDAVKPKGWTGPEELIISILDEED